MHKERDLAACKPSQRKGKGLDRSPVRTRARFKAEQTKSETDEEGKGEGDGEEETPQTSSRSLAQASRAEEAQTQPTRSKKSSANTTELQSTSDDKQTEDAARVPINDRPYCTQRCLLGLAQSGSLDQQCPNFHDHRAKHIKAKTLRRLLRKQLAVDRGPDADCMPLWIQGARGALFKIRLSSHGYTFVTKGMEAENVRYLQREERVYGHIQAIQGEHVPVCLGGIDLIRPYYFNGGVYMRMLFLSWAGRTVFDCTSAEAKIQLQNKASKALEALHKLQVLHCDPEPRNMLMDNGRLMLVDFERATICEQQPLGAIAGNGKRKHINGKEGASMDSDYAREVQRARACIARTIRSSHIDAGI